MSASPTQTRSIRVRQRLLTIGAASLIGFGAMIGVGWYGNSTIAAAAERQLPIGESVALVNERHIDKLDMAPAALDTIVDRADGKVSAARIDMMIRSIATLRDQAGAIERLDAFVRLPPQAAAPVARPTASPARNLVDRLAGAFQQKPSPKTASVASGANDSNWEEFQ